MAVKKNSKLSLICLIIVILALLLIIDLVTWLGEEREVKQWLNNAEQNTNSETTVDDAKQWLKVQIMNNLFCKVY